MGFLEQASTRKHAPRGKNVLWQSAFSGKRSKAAEGKGWLFVSRIGITNAGKMATQFPSAKPRNRQRLFQLHIFGEFDTFADFSSIRFWKAGGRDNCAH